MATGRRVPWSRLERWRAVWFVTAGILLAAQGVFIGWAAGELIARFELADGDYWFQIVGFWVWVWFFGAVGLAVSVGLLGLYPTLEQRRPRLARAGAALALASTAVGLVVAALPVLAVVGHGLGLFSNVGDNPMFGVYNGVFMPYAWVQSLSVLAFGAGALWTEAPSRIVGGLLVIAAVYPRPPLGLNLQTVVPVPGVAVGVVALLAVASLLYRGNGPAGTGPSEPPRFRG